MVVSAPTGSGKTVLFELCILRLLSRFISQDSKFVPIKGTLKTVSSLFSLCFDLFFLAVFKIKRKNVFILNSLIESHIYQEDNPFDFI